MHYQKRPDGKIAVTIDSNVWNLFFDKYMRLADELPPSKFMLFIPREVEIETYAMSNRTDKDGLLKYIQGQIVESSIRTTAVFSFASTGTGPQRGGNFGSGTFQSESNRAFYAAVHNKALLSGKIMGSQLYKNEADAALGACAFSSVVLTCDTKAGPLSLARELGGKVLYLQPDCVCEPSLADCISRYHELN